MKWFVWILASIGAFVVAVNVLRLALDLLYRGLELTRCDIWWCWRPGGWSVLKTWSPNHLATEGRAVILGDAEECDEHDEDEHDEDGHYRIWPKEANSGDLLIKMQCGCYCKRCGDHATRKEAMAFAVEDQDRALHLEVSLVPYDETLGQEPYWALLGPDSPPQT
jgi:hypothetical protein